ncbi:MAG: polyprenyl synthetase family protein [Halothermotrichaceae bacterium]
MKDFKKILKEYAVEVNDELKKVMNLQEEILSETLLSSMKYTLFSGGKRIRPILTIMTAEMIGGSREAALRVGAAMELIHTYSLIHDDLPSMDNDDFRRGKKTNHNIYGTAVAILAGDGLLTYAFNLLSQLSLAPENIIEIIRIISDGAGHNGMVGGQVLDIEAENKKVNLDQLRQIHKGKTGALFKSSILAGAHCGNPDSEERQALSDFSKYLGLTFQIVDDILDVVGNEEKLGKRVGSDQELNKSTYPILLGLEEARKEAKSTASRAKKSLTIFGKKAKKLQSLMDYIVIRQS